MQGIVHAILLLLHLNLRSGTDVKHSYTAGQLSQTLLQLLLVVVRRGRFDLRLDLVDACFDGLLAAMTLHDGGVVLVDSHLLSRTQHIHLGVFELHALLFGDDGAASQYGDVFQHGLATVAEARSLHGAHLEAATQTVHNEGRQRFAVDILSDDQQSAARLYDLLEDGQEVLQDGDLLVVDEDVGVLILRLHLLRVGHEVGGDVAAVELHTLDHFDGRVRALSLFYGDDTFFLHFLHGLGDQLADALVAVGRNLSHMLDAFHVRAHLFGLCGDTLYDLGYGLVDTALQVHRVSTGGDVLQTYADDGLCQNGCGSRTVASLVVRLGGYLLNQLCAHVLVRAGQLDFLGHRHAVLGDLRCAKFLLDDHVATLGAERYFDCICQFVYALFQ